MQLSQHIEIFCIIPTNLSEATINCTDDDMILAHKCCKEHDFNVVWISEEICLKLKPCKENLFVLTDFDGLLFEFLQSFECTILSPQCLLILIDNGQPIPGRAIFNFAMKGVTVSSTGLGIQENKNIKMKMEFMGGIYSAELTPTTTHLLAKSVADFSWKFKAARLRNIPVMIPELIYEVWDTRTQQKIVHGTQDFSSYICPIFQGFVMCVSQVSPKKREAMKKNFEANGGQYSAQLERGKTNILLIKTADGEKYVHARSWKIPCLRPEWLWSSLKKGYVCDPEPFVVEKDAALPPKSSIPEVHDRSVAKFCNDSANSTIFNNNPNTCQIDETQTSGIKEPNPELLLLTANDSKDQDDQEKEEEVAQLLNFSSAAGTIFSGLTFHLDDLLDADSVSLMTNLIESNGGQLVVNDSKFIVEPIISAHALSFQRDPVKQVSVVNTFWIENCVDDDCLVDFEIYHVPIKVKNIMLFADCVVSFSGIFGRLAEFLEYLIVHLGGNQRKSFSRKIVKEKNLLPSTHLVCNEAEGTKYEKAIQWEVAVVNANWIIDCASSNTRLEEADYPPESFAVKKSSIPVSVPIISFGVPSPDNLIDSPPLVIAAPSEDSLLSFLLPTEPLFTDGRTTFGFGISPTPRPALSNMSTPDTPYGRLLNADPSPDTRKMWKHALDNRVRLTPRSESSASPTSPKPSEEDVSYVRGMDYFERIYERLTSGEWEVTPTPQTPVVELAPFHDVVTPDAARYSDVPQSFIDDPHQVPENVDLEQPNSSAVFVTRNLNQSQRLNASHYNSNLLRVMFTGMSQEDRDSCIQIIKNLGGIAIDDKNYDATCTHLVVANVCCNNKLITSIAAGKWIVHPGWIAESEDAYHFVDERKFEWGNPVSNDSISVDESRIAAAAYYWRTSRNRGLSGPFKGITAALYLNEIDAFQKLIEAGDGEVIAPELALKNGKTNLCVLDSRELCKIQLPEFACKGIYCVPPNYLRDLILSIDKKLQWLDCVVPEFLPYLDAIPSHLQT